MRTIAFSIPKIPDETSADYTISYGIAILSALVKHQGLCDRTFYSDNIEELLTADEVWVTGLTEAWKYVNILGKKIIEHGKRFKVGGHHATALPQTLKYGEAFAGPYEDLQNTDNSPLPDWDVYPNLATKRAMLVTSYGCPFSCRFCSSKAFWKQYAVKSPKRIIEEIKDLANRGFKDIILFDDLFTARRKHLQETVERICAEGLNYLTYSCLVRADSVDAKTVALLKQMNVTSVAFGAESGSDKILLNMNKKTSRAINQRAIDILHGMGFGLNSGVVVGFPGESKETLAETQDFIFKNKDKVNGIDAFPCVPLPGTWLWERFVEKYKPDLDTFDWEALRIRANKTDWSKYPVMSDEITVNDLKKFCEWNHRLFHQNEPLYTQKEKNMPEEIISEQNGLSFVWHTNEPHISIDCPVCKTHQEMQHIVTRKTIHSDTNYYKCPACGTVFPYPTVFLKETNEDQYNQQTYWKFYTELAAGIQFMVAPLQCVPKMNHPMRMLDVGCGFGFALFYAKIMFDAETLGYEPGKYGQWGKRILDVNIQREYFASTKEKFDIVYSSEVIEHVEHPEAFLDTLVSALSDDGILVITTPDADAVTRERCASGSLVQMLTPEHIYLQSAKSMEVMLSKYTFAEIHCIKRIGRLILIASKKYPISYDNIDNRDVYNTFIKHACLYAAEKKNTVLLHTFLFQQIKCLIADGNFEAAKTCASRYMSALKSYGNPETIYQNLDKFFAEKPDLTQGKNLEKLCSIIPANFPVFLFYQAQICITDHQYLFAVNNFRSCRRYCEDMYHLLGKNAPLELADIIWHSLYYEGMVHIQLEHLEEAKECFASVIECKLDVRPKPHQRLVSQTIKLLKDIAKDLGAGDDIPTETAKKAACDKVEEEPEKKNDVVPASLAESLETIQFRLKNIEEKLEANIQALPGLKIAPIGTNRDFSFYPLGTLSVWSNIPSTHVTELGLHLTEPTIGATCGLEIRLLDTSTSEKKTVTATRIREISGAGWYFVPFSIPEKYLGTYALFEIRNFGAGRPPMLSCAFVPGVSCMKFNDTPLPNTICSLTFRTEEKSEAEKDLLILTPDVLGTTRIGLGMRHWEIAKTLAKLGFSVTLMTCANRLPDDLSGEGFALVQYENLIEEIKKHKCVLTQGAGIYHLPEAYLAGKKLIVDMITPMQFEQIAGSRREFDAAFTCVDTCLSKGDFFICGNARQRLYWLGMLTAKSRVNQRIAAHDPELKNLIDSVPFGIADDIPVFTKHGIRNEETGFTNDHFILLWFGGIWDWFNPVPFIRAIGRVRKTRPEIRVYFSMFAQKGLPPTQAALRAYETAKAENLLDCIYFRPEPVPFSERADCLLDADLGVVFQEKNAETEISARTRIYDYFWANLPVLVTRGDAISEILAKKTPDLVLNEYSEEEIAKTILFVMENKNILERAKNEIKALTEELSWRKQIRPLANYIRKQ